MRVTIEHREETIGNSGKHHNYFVDCQVEFSEEEKAIIQARSLEDHIVIEAQTRAPAAPSEESSAMLKGCLGRLLLLAGGIIFIQSFFTGSGGGFGILALLIGGGVTFYGWIGEQDAQEPRVIVPISVGRLMSSTPVPLYAPDPAAAKALDEQFREALVSLKRLIAASAEMRGKDTFEL